VFDSVAVVAPPRRGDHYPRAARIAKVSLPQDQVPGLAEIGGQADPVRRRQYTVEELRPEAFDGVELAISSTPDDVGATSSRRRPRAACHRRSGFGGWTRTCRWSSPRSIPMRSIATRASLAAPTARHANGPGPQAAAPTRAGSARGRQHYQAPAAPTGRHRDLETARAPFRPGRTISRNAFPTASPSIVSQIGGPKHRATRPKK